MPHASEIVSIDVARTPWQCLPSVVPNCEIVWSPLKAHLRIVILGYKIEQVVQNQVRLIFCDAVDALGETFVDVDRLPSSHRCRVLVPTLLEIAQINYSRFVRITGWTAVNASPKFNGLPRMPFRIGLPNLSASSKKNFAS